MKKASIFWQTYLNLEKELLDLSKYIFITDEILENQEGQVSTRTCNSQLEVFSPYIADLLVRCCIQIEAISKELYFDVGGEKQRGDSSLLFDTDCLKEIDKKWATHNKVVLVVSPSFNLTTDNNIFLKPLKEAHKKQGTDWERAYQAVKHDRYSSLQKGTVKAFLHALAALYLLNLYYRNDVLVTNYNGISTIDYSFGSSIFSVNSPTVNEPWYENSPILSDSPYVATYRDSDYQHIQEMQNSESQAINNYLSNQPEWPDSRFQEQLKKAIDIEKSNPSKKVFPIWELSKYRLNQKVPSTLSFDARKKGLLESAEWNSSVHQANKSLSADDITEKNIQEEIDSAGMHQGMEIMKQLQPLEWVPFARTQAVCKIYIPQST